MNDLIPPAAPPRRRLLLPDMSLVMALVVALAVSGVTALWTESRLTEMEKRLQSQVRASTALRAAPSSAATGTAPEPASGVTASIGAPAPAPGTLARFTSMASASSTIEAQLVLVQRVEGKSAAAVAASFGDAPTDGVYIVDTGERTASATVAVRTPVRILRNPVPGSPPPADAAALAAALRGPKAAIWKRCYFVVRLDGLYITEIVQADAPLRSR